MGGSAFTQNVEIKNGVNIQASYYNFGHVNIDWELMKTYPEIEAVRIEIEPNRVYQAIEWIREAHENGYQVIATYHFSQVLGSDERDELIKAANWWEHHYEKFIASGPVIINLMNEWGSHDLSPEEYAGAYNEAIHIVRSFYDDQLIIDVPGFGQATKIAADAYPLLEDQNIVYSIHVYTSAFNIEQKRWLAHEDLAYLDATGANCMVGEFCDNSRGGADWCTIIDECYVNGWPLFGWAWNGDGHGMNMIEPHWREEPLADEYRPTKFMDIIINKLAGIPCYTIPDEECNNSLIGESCDDGNDYTVDDRFNEFCHCTGNFTDAFQSNTSGFDMLIYPNPISSQDNEFAIDFFKLNRSGQLTIYNSLGHVVWTKNIDRNEVRLFFDSSQFSTGIYWASYRNDLDFKFSKAFMVN